MNRFKSWDATSLGWLIKNKPMDAAKSEPVGVFFGFRGMPATITVQKADGTYVDGVKVEVKEPENGNEKLPAA